MAITTVSKESQRPNYYFGLSTDTKPDPATINWTDRVPSYFYENDTGNMFRYDGAYWVKVEDRGRTPSTDPYADIEEGKYPQVGSWFVPQESIVHKFGKNGVVGTTWEPLSINGIYRTPQPAAATALRVRAGNVNDTAAGTGAREVTLQGLDETGLLTTEAIATAGTSASAATTTTWMRVFRAYVSDCGTYSDLLTTSSQAADVVVETAGGVEWLTIELDAVPGKGQSQIGLYTVPLNYTAYVHNFVMTTDSNKAVDFMFFKRESILDAAAPYQAVRSVTEEVGIAGSFDSKFLGGQKFNELTDIGFLVRASAAAEVTVDFQIKLIGGP